MAGGSSQHGVIIHNIGGALWQRLDDKPCVIFGSDVRLKVDATGLYTYPDIMVVCGAIQHADDRKDIVLNPVLIVEIPSPSIRDYDRRQKFQQYRALPSLREYLTVAQDTPHVEHWTRGEQSGSFTEYDDLSQTIRLASIGVDLPLSSIYRKVDFSPGS